MRRFLLTLSLIGLLYSSLQGQSFTFADTHPVNNPDSLEQWLAANPNAPALVRLRNLIRLENTYLWGYQDQKGSTLPTVTQVHRQLHSPLSRAAYFYVQALAQARTNPAGVSQYGLAFLEACKALHDTTGMVMAYCMLASNAIKNYGDGAKSGSSFLMNYITSARTLAFTGRDQYARLLWSYTAGTLVYAPAYQQGQQGRSGNMLDTLKTRVAEGLSLIKQGRGRFDYASYNFQLLHSLTYQLDGKLPACLAINEKLLATLRPRQATSRLSLLYNVGTAYCFLKNYPKAISFYQQAVDFFERDTILTMKPFPPLYYNFGKVALEAGYYKKAAVLYDSAYQQLNKQQKILNEKSRLEQESRYQLRERQQENARLKQQKALDDAQRQTYILALTAATAIILLIAFFALRLLRNRRQIQQANAQLTQLLEERQQTNAQLANTLAEVQQLIKARERFIGIIAHDLRKPLISFQGLASLVGTLLKQGAYSQIKAISQSIDAAGNQIETMLDNLLQWALNQREAVPYHPKNLRLNEALHTVVDMYQTLTRFQDIALTVTCPPALMVWADANGLQLIIRNLVDNALKQVGTEGKITLTADQLDEETVQLQIADSGPGLSSERLGYLQGVLADETRGEVGQQGLGLGLLLVRDFVLKNQGRIGVESPPGSGACFIVRLPAQKQDRETSNRGESMNVA